MFITIFCPTFRHKIQNTYLYFDFLLWVQFPWTAVYIDCKERQGGRGRGGLDRWNECESATEASSVHWGNWRHPGQFVTTWDECKYVRFCFPAVSLQRLNAVERNSGQPILFLTSVRGDDCRWSLQHEQRCRSVLGSDCVKSRNDAWTFTVKVSKLLSHEPSTFCFFFCIFNYSQTSHSFLVWDPQSPVEMLCMCLQQQAWAPRRSCTAERRPEPGHRETRVCLLIRWFHCERALHGRNPPFTGVLSHVKRVNGKPWLWCNTIWGSVTIWVDCIWFGIISMDWNNNNKKQSVYTSEWAAHVVTRSKS